MDGPDFGTPAVLPVSAVAAHLLVRRVGEVQDVVPRGVRAVKDVVRPQAPHEQPLLQRPQAARAHRHHQGACDAPPESQCVRKRGDPGTQRLLGGGRAPVHDLPKVLAVDEQRVEHDGHLDLVRPGGKARHDADDLGRREEELVAHLLAQKRHLHAQEGALTSFLPTQLEMSWVSVVQFPLEP